MSHYEDGRAWLSLAIRPIGDASTSIVDALARQDAPILNCIEHAKGVIARLDDARANALRALIYFQIAKDEEAKP